MLAVTQSMDRHTKDFHSKERFSNRVEAYLKYRPHYPAEIIDYLQNAIQLSPADIVADIGSGTGFLAELFLKFGNPVFGVEPNREMLLAGEGYLRNFPRFTSVDGAAEQTHLADRSVDIVVAGQAFHWFSPPQFLAECRRILRGKSVVCLIWNERDLDATPLMREYEALLNQCALDYNELRHDNITPEDLQSFFGQHPMHTVSFPYRQLLDREGFKGRVLSSSYTPTDGHPAYDGMIRSLDTMFEKYNTGGAVEILYETKVYWAAVW